MKYKTHGGAEVEFESVENAKGITGFLLPNGDEFIFRVYDTDGKGNKIFTDYPIAHSDLEVKIVGEAAFYHKSNGKLYLDHSLKTLGWEQIDGE